MPHAGRRAVILAALALPYQGGLARLHPDRAAPLFFDPEEAVLRCGGLIGAIRLPRQRARFLLTLPVAARQVAVLGFGADQAGGRLDMLAIAGFDGEGLRILALEALRWRGSDGAALETRLAADAGRQTLRLERDGVRMEAGRRRRESWTDYLAWRPGTCFADAPVRPPLPGTQQAALAAHRRAAIAWLETARQDTEAAPIPPDPLGDPAFPLAR